MEQSLPQRPGATDGPGPLSRLEKAVLAEMLRGEGEARAILRAQLDRSRVVSRTHSGVGFVTRLAVPEEVPALPEPASPGLRPVLADHPGLSDPAEFLLQLRGGRLAALEAYCFAGQWPADEAEFRVLVSPC
jgi:hypothetical protein